VATALLEPSSSYPFRKFFFAGKKIFNFRLGQLKAVVPENKVILHNGELTYDHLVFATGCRNKLFWNG
jgi:NADH dehydrogenase